MERFPLSDKFAQEDKFLNALAEAYRLQEAIISATELAVISTNAEGIITSFNNAAEFLLGYSSEEVIGKETPLLFHDGEEINLRKHELEKELGVTIQSLFDTFIIKSLVTKTADRQEWTYIKKNGTRFPVSLSITSLYDDKENLIGYAGIATDITEQKRSEQKLKSSEAHLQALLNSVDDIVIEANRHGVYTNVWTKKDHMLFVQPRQEYIGASIYEVLKEPLLSQYLEAIDRVYKTEQSQHIEYPVGDDQWRSSKISFIDQDKVIILIRDITEKKKAEVALQQSEQKFRLLAENLPGTIYLCNNDQDFSMIYLNEKVEDLCGYSASDFLSHEINFVKLYHPDDAERIFEVVENALQEKKNFELEYRIRHRSGEWRWVKEDGIGVYEDDKLTMIEGFLIDITERRKAEAELLRSKQNLESVALKLQEQNRQLDEFAHIISHNLRSPVGNIKALINLLDATSTLADYQLIFEKLKNVASNLGETMNELMDTLKAKKTTEIERVEIRFEEILQKVKQSLEGELIRKSGTVHYNFDLAPSLLYSRTYIESIFQNLLSNAIKYSSQDRNPEVFFETEQLDSYIELRVRDNGLGIDLDKFGDKLFGLHKTFHDHSDARGVGLFLIKTQIEALGGSIVAESKVNEGTTFIIRFAC
ncbi:MAG: PAS domain S-box protein [Cyclobacteriaceae bacterium]|nr:PAS domain S-box protein [Cyclobacteriaceae bacterium]